MSSLVIIFSFSPTRLQGLSAVVQDHSKITPPSDSRPEPEGKEGHGCSVYDAVLNSTFHGKFHVLAIEIL